MCLIVFAWKAHPNYPLVLAANRDEYLQRRTQPLALWADAPDVAGGRDVEKGGTWLATNRKGRWAAVTNFRDGRPQQSSALSRGHLVRDFVTSDVAAETYARDILPDIGAYPGCNLLLGDADAIFCVSNRHPQSPHARIESISPGVYGLSNHLLDTPWPKVKRTKQVLQNLVATGSNNVAESLLATLSDRTVASDNDLPSTGIPLTQERLLSPPFIVADGYGTRASTVIVIDDKGKVHMQERCFGAGGKEISRNELSV